MNWKKEFDISGSIALSSTTEHCFQVSKYNFYAKQWNVLWQASSLNEISIKKCRCNKDMKCQASFSLFFI